ncbi:hypothetical protein ACIP6P_00630 [Streptomyces sp. NPDC088729]|uniref:hypothetical protein n=1 Tax=Streptomyces sp. NPDC088729 TaxID=3365876 RepID=UPI003825A6B6
MRKLDQPEPYNWHQAFRGAADETVAAPLWDFPPEARAAQLSERKRRSILQGDPEQTGDPEYT